MSQRWIYHITHIDNLAGIGSEGLLSDASRISAGVEVQLVGMSEIKRRRLEEVRVDCCAVPWSLIEWVGVQSEGHLPQVQEILRTLSHQPKVVVRENWYY